MGKLVACTVWPTQTDIPVYCIVNKFTLEFNLFDECSAGYANVLYQTGQPSAAGLHSDVIGDASSSHDVILSSANPALAYALLALGACVLNFAINVGVGIYFLRQRRSHESAPYYDDDVTDDVSILENEDQLEDETSVRAATIPDNLSVTAMARNN